MLQAKMFEPYKIELLDIEKPVLKDNEVLVKMERVGICGSDIHVYRGRHKYMSFPVVQGHEGSGTIADMGKAVTNIQLGDQVIFHPQFFCGKCYACKTGRYNVCEDLKTIGIHQDGLVSEYVAIDSSKVIKVPQGVSFDEAAIAEPLAIGVHTVNRCGEVKNKNILILGAGTIGNLVAQSFNAFGAGKVAVTDIVDYKLKIASECGIKYCINVKEVDMKNKILEIFGEDKADVIVDCAGSKSSITQAIEYSRNASKIIIVANFNDPVTIEIPRLQRREIDILTIINSLREDLVEALNLIKDKKVKVLKLITKHFNIKDFSHAYDLIHSTNDVVKIMIKIE